MRQLRRIFLTIAMAPALGLAATCSPEVPEKFVEFLPTFSESKDFATERTVLPLPLLLWRDGRQEGEGQALSASEYRRWPSLNQYMRDNDLYANVKTQTKTHAVIELYKEGSDGLVSFDFKVKDGCWYLWRYEVRSN